MKIEIVQGEFKRHAIVRSDYTEVFELDDQVQLTEFVRYVTWETYNKYGTDNLYVLRGWGQKEGWEVYDLYYNQIDEDA